MKVNFEKENEPKNLLLLFCLQAGRVEFAPKVLVSLSSFIDNSSSS